MAKMSELVSGVPPLNPMDMQGAGHGGHGHGHGAVALSGAEGGHACCSESGCAHGGHEGGHGDAHGHGHGHGLMAAALAVGMPTSVDDYLRAAGDENTRTKKHKKADVFCPQIF